MRDPSLSYDDVLRIVELVKSSRFTEFRLKVGEIEVHLRRSGPAETPATPASPAAAVPAAEHVTAGAASRHETGGELVRSPMVGTFYRAPAPDAPPFVEVGQRVEPDSTVCIIEVMKLMNSIGAGVRGVVTEILATNGASVEYDQPLIVIRPDGEDG